MTTNTNPDRITELHRLCDEDYAKGQKERAAARGAAVEPTDLDVAISVAQQLLDSDSILSMRESLRLLLRALGAEPTPLPRKTSGGRFSSQEDKRCPSAHPEDPTPCSGPPTVTVLDATNAGADGCEHHGARLLASLQGGRVYALPDAPAGSAIRVFKAAGSTRPFAWVERGEGQ